MSESAAQSALTRALSAARPGVEPAWLERLRADAGEAFRASGLPTTRLEDWRFTPLAKLERYAFAPAASASASPALLAPLLARVGESHLLVFVNGRLAPELSRVGGLPPECRVESLRAALTRDPDTVRRSLAACGDAKRRPFEALNTALFSDGAFVALAPGARLDRPIHLVFLCAGSDAPEASHLRNLVVAGSDSRAIVVEHHVGAAGAPALTNAVTELRIERAADLQHVLLQELPETSFGFLALLSRQETASRLALHSIALGASLARVELDARLEGEHAELDANGLYLGHAAQHQDHHTTIDHAAPRTTSREHFKGILDGRAHGVFHGRIHVRPDSQKIDATQTNRSLLLSDGAVLDAKPQLEIYADDVKCSHGASIGQLDPDQIFYLRARGLDLERARALLTFAFASEMLAKLPLAELRESLERAVLAWLPLGGAP